MVSVVDRVARNLHGPGVRYIAFTLGGYHLVTSGEGGASTRSVLTATPHSKIVDLGNFLGPALEDARDPMLSVDGRNLAFVRDHLGRGRLMMRVAGQSAAEVALTPPSLNVYEASFLSAKEYAFSGGRPMPAADLFDR